MVLKGESYKLCHSKIFMFNFVIILIYSIFVNYLYYVDGLNINDLFTTFNDEYLLIYLSLTLYYSSSCLVEEYSYNVIYDHNINKLIIVKIFVFFIYVFIIFFISVILCYDVAIFFLKECIIDFNVIKELFIIFIKLIPMIILLNLVCMFLSIIFLKSNLALGITIIFYILSNYIKSIVINKGIESLYYLPMFHWDLNYNVLNYNQCLRICIILVFAILLIFLIFLLCKNKRSS